MTDENGDEINIELTEEQKKSPGIDDWVQAKRIGGKSDNDDQSQSLHIIGSE